MRNRTFRPTKKKVAIGVVIITAGTAGVAAALWSASGSGSGQASSLTAQTLTVEAAAGDADLYPGFTDGDLYFTVDNPNPYAVTFDSFTAGTVTSSDETACPASNVTVDASGAIALNVAANSTDVAGSIADVVAMSAAAGDGCQNQQFTITLTLSGSQS